MFMNSGVSYIHCNWASEEPFFFLNENFFRWWDRTNQYHGALYMKEMKPCLYLPNYEANLIIVLLEISLLFCHFINTTAKNLGWSKLSSPINCRSPCQNCCCRIEVITDGTFTRIPLMTALGLWRHRKYRPLLLQLKLDKINL